VVLIHGITGNMAIWPLIDLIDDLARDFRVTYFDLRGHGYSDTPPESYTSADMAGDLHNLQTVLGLGPMLLVGHSFGGVVAAHAAVLYPEQVRGLILSDAFFADLADVQGEITAWDGWQAYVQQSAEMGLEVRPENWSDVDAILRQAAELSPERREKFVDQLGEPALQRLVRLSETTCGVDTGKVAGLSRERIVSIRQPVLALYGQQSPFLPTCRFLVENLPNCKADFIPGAKHLAHEEQPEEFVATVQKHLRAMAGIGEAWHSEQTISVGAPW
jgi:pimeloyl-ACP methyl ester carboxylesterase